jgi:hypothetical protein
MPRDNKPVKFACLTVFKDEKIKTKNRVTITENLAATKNVVNIFRAC